ncbi:MAG: methyltransferase [Bacilli bacterium]|jgi:16S rRNA (guanine1207-N2)-methyltransferase
MSHYFENDDSLISKRRIIELSINGRTLSFLSDNGVFSKNHVDDGSRLLIETLLSEHLIGKVLEIGTGYGVICLTLASFIPNISVIATDVNMRALALCKSNIERLKLSDRVTCLQSDLYASVEGLYDSIVTNPPIRAGKKLTYALYQGALDHLIDGGSIYIVIRKSQGAESTLRYLDTLFARVEILNRDKGFYVLKASK